MNIFSSLLLSLSPLLLFVPVAMAVTSGNNEAGPAPDFGKIPLFFEKNAGQIDGSAKFISRAPGFTMYLTDRGAVVALRNNSSRSTASVSMELLGSSPEARISGEDEQPGKSNYLMGNKPGKWITDVPTYGKVRYENVYPGIDVVYYGNNRQLEYDLIVSPGVDYKNIDLAFKGTNGISLDGEGNLVLSTDTGKLVQKAPVIYQEVAGVRKEVKGHYKLTGKGSVGFELAAYDTSIPLTIDPILSYSTYLGGSAWDKGSDLAVRSDGRVIVVGETTSLDFPIGHALYDTNSGGYDVFVTELKADGRVLSYSTYIGGSGRDRAFGVTAASDGTAYVTGDTDSSDFPVTANAYQPSLAGGRDAFVLRLSPKGKDLEYSTYLGGTSNEIGYGIALGQQEDAYMSGQTRSADFPSKNAVQPMFGGYYDAVVARIDTAMNGDDSLVYATFVGGEGWEEALRIDVDAYGSAYIVGDTDSEDFPTTPGAYQESYQTYPADVFVTKVSADGSAFVYSTYLGSPLLPGDDPDDVWKEEEGWAIDVDGDGHAYVTGFTDSADFPYTPGAYHSPSTATPGNDDVFITKLSLDGSSLVYSAIVGGEGLEKGTGIAVDSSGNPYITGWTVSGDFPVLDAYQSTPNGYLDAYVTKLNAAGTSLVYSTYFPSDRVWSIAVDDCENAYITGEAGPDLPTTWQAFQTASGSGRDAFVTKFEGIPNCALTGE